jgi:ubiquinone/menaquinone biosynthesis C-methylase UbiE
MAPYDLRSLLSVPSHPETDLPALVLLGQMWWYASTTLYPAQFLKSLGLYSANAIGRYPEPCPTAGEGRLYCRQHQEPCYLQIPSSEENSVAYFDRIATIYDTCVDPFTRPVYDEALKLMKPLLPLDARILDTSCGPGTALFRLTSLTPQGEVVAMDLSAGMVTAAYKRARQQGLFNTAFFQADVAAMPAHFTARFDATFCFGAFHHYPDPAGAVREMWRVLNSHGLAFVVDPGPWWFKLLGSPFARWGDPGWVNFYTGEELRDFFFSVGFSDFYWTEVLPGFGMGIASK